MIPTRHPQPPSRPTFPLKGGIVGMSGWCARRDLSGKCRDGVGSGRIAAPSPGASRRVVRAADAPQPPRCIRGVCRLGRDARPGRDARSSVVRRSTDDRSSEGTSARFAGVRVVRAADAPQSRGAAKGVVTIYAQTCIDSASLFQNAEPIGSSEPNRALAGNASRDCAPVVAAGIGSMHGSEGG